jgi:hypothetical protein
MGAPPQACDLCQKPIETSFIDGNIKGTTRWGCMCLRCHREAGVGVAPGVGQLYQRQVDGRWLKTQG